MQSRVQGVSKDTAIDVLEGCAIGFSPCHGIIAAARGTQIKSPSLSPATGQSWILIEKLTVVC